jgi:hypothetical protein
VLIEMVVPARSLAIVALRPAPARADTVISVINLPGFVIDNQCNGEPVGLSGELLTVVTTRPTPRGGTTLRAVWVTQGGISDGSPGYVAGAWISFHPPPDRRPLGKERP